jgi:hypothetical protein
MKRFVIVPRYGPINCASGLTLGTLGMKTFAIVPQSFPKSSALILAAYWWK